MALDRTGLETALGALGEVLHARELTYELILVGGGNLLIRGVITRPTRDADIVAQIEDGRIRTIDVLPDALRQAVEDVARTYGLRRDWLNLGPRSLLELGLPEGFQGRLERIDYGALAVWFAGRYDLVCFKLYAAADHWPSASRHLQDLEALSPTREDLDAAARWARTHDPSAAFSGLLDGVLQHLGYRTGDDSVR